MKELIDAILNLPHFSTNEWETISEIISSLQGCSLSLLKQKDDEEIDPSILENARNTKIPILIKHKKTLKIYGNPIGNDNPQDWTNTAINSYLADLNVLSFTETINTINSSNTLLSHALRKVLKPGHLLLEQKTTQEFQNFIHENNITMYEATRDRIITFLTLWPITVSELISWEKKMVDKWSKIFHEAITGDDLVPLTIACIPNIIKPAQLKELLTKLNQASYIEIGDVAYTIANYQSAFSAKLTDIKPDNDFLRKFILYQAQTIYDQYNYYLLQCINDETHLKPSLLYAYYHEMGISYENRLCTKDELKLLKSTHPEFIALLTKYKTSLDILFSIENPYKKILCKCIEVHEKLVYWQKKLSEPAKKQTSSDIYFLDRISLFSSSNDKDPEHIFREMNKHVITTMHSLINEAQEQLQKNTLTPTPHA